MKAAVFHAPHQPLTIEDVEIEKPKRREVLLRTAYAGLPAVANDDGSFTLVDTQTRLVPVSAR